MTRSHERHEVGHGANADKSWRCLEIEAQPKKILGWRRCTPLHVCLGVHNNYCSNFSSCRFEWSCAYSLQSTCWAYMRSNQGNKFGFHRHRCAWPRRILVQNHNSLDSEILYLGQFYCLGALHHFFDTFINIEKGVSIAPQAYCARRRNKTRYAAVRLCSSAGLRGRHLDGKRESSTHFHIPSL